MIARRVGEMDTLTVQIESTDKRTNYDESVASVLKMRGIVEVVAPGSLPNDGLVIEDQRKYD